MEEIEIERIKMEINEKTKPQETSRQAEDDDDSTRCWGVSCDSPPPPQEEEEELEELEIS
jgi:hypothetical protein